MNKPTETLSLQKFPGNYKAMFAISSDVDHAVSQSAYLEFMKYLNTERETLYGTGLGLEISNSFWFYNNAGDDQLSYFKALSSTETPFAEPCRELWRSGHIDALHSYGDFNTGGFTRGLAETAISELNRQGFAPPVWINHGNDLNQQNLGNIQPYQGADPTSPAYHLDLLREVGTRFFWTGRTTHVAGQDASFSLGNQLQQKLQKLVLKTKYRKIQRPLPDPPNRLLIRTELADGSSILDFQRFISRFGEVKNTDFHDLALQLSDGNLSSLVNSGGFMLLYTHMNENLPQAGPLPLPVVEGFKRLKHLQDQGQLLVTTTSRLLTYADQIQHLTWDVKSTAKTLQLHLHRDDHQLLTLDNLQGITFNVSSPQPVELYLNNEPLSIHLGESKSRGQSKVSIPWQPLVYPL